MTEKCHYAGDGTWASEERNKPVELTAMNRVGTVNQGESKAAMSFWVRQFEAMNLRDLELESLVVGFPPLNIEPKLKDDAPSKNTGWH